VLDVNGMAVLVDAVENAPRAVMQPPVIGTPGTGPIGPGVLSALVGGLQEGVNADGVVLEMRGRRIEGDRLAQNLPVSLTPPGRIEESPASHIMRDRSLGAAESAVALKAGESEGVLKIFEFGGRDEDRGRNSAVRQGDVLVLSGTASELSKLASGFGDRIGG
jgi:hypothetical protein